MSEVNRWSVFCAARFDNGKCVEDFDMRHLSWGQPQMVPAADYDALAARLAEAERLLAEGLRLYPPYRDDPFPPRVRAFLGTPDSATARESGEDFSDG